MNVLGISAYDHGAAAALVRDGEIIAAAEEERFTRIKHDWSFPRRAIAYCLEAGHVGAGQLDAVVFYERPFRRLGRILAMYLEVAPRGVWSFGAAVRDCVEKMLAVRREIRMELRCSGCGEARGVWFISHEEAHAASAYFPSPFERAAVVTVDTAGEWATSTIGIGEGPWLRILREQRYPHSLGLLYSAFTQYCGFEVNGGEYKLMGLAPYGQPRYVGKIMGELVQVREDGSLQVNVKYFSFLWGEELTTEAFHELFGGAPRRPWEDLTAREADIARSIQVVTEEVVLRMVRHAREVTGAESLCLGGEVGLNCVVNGRVAREGGFSGVWIQPAAGDAGGAVGAALYGWHHIIGGGRECDGVHDKMKGAYLGPEFSDEEIGAFLRARGYSARLLGKDDWAEYIAELLVAQRVVGLVQGRMEFGPRALGNRSILADPRSPTMQKLVNERIKCRELFRPFAPSCRVERAGEYFELDRPSPYMLLVARVRPERWRTVEEGRTKTIMERANEVRSDIPAVTHVDYSARVQTVDRDTNPRFYALLEAWERKSGCGVLLNTSFNVRGEPIVCTPEDAYRCFMETEIDYLVLGSYVLDKRAQRRSEDSSRRKA
ncbi:MAG: carbamoyltransferase [bacterium]|nr:carbamoyltransferase [bacterium]